MKTLKHISLGATICLLSMVVLHAQHGNGWSVAGPRNIAGRILSVHVDVQNDQRVYAGAAGGGFWVSTNGGNSWNRSVSFEGSAAVSAIAQSSDGTIYVGTGEGLNMNYSEPGVHKNNYPYGITGDGVYKSTDRGLTFVRLENTEQWQAVNSIAYDNKNNKLYVATNEGLKISSDDGASFVNAPAPIITDKGICVRVGKDGSVIYSNLGSTGTVYVSTDDGVTFASVCGSAAGKLPNDGSGRISVAVAPSNPDVMYALIANYNGEFAGVYVSKNKGQTWREIFPAGSSRQDPMRGWGSYCNAISVSQENPLKVLLGGLILYRGEEYNESEYYTWNTVNSEGFIHSIDYVKDNVAYLGMNTGVGTLDGALHNNMLGTLQVYTLGVGNDGRYMVGTRENGTVIVENPNGALKTGKRMTLKGVNGADCVFSMIKPEALFYTASYGYCCRQASLTSEMERPVQWMGGALADTNTIAGNYFYNNIINRTKRPVADTAVRWDADYNGISGQYVNPYVSPLAIWESVNDEHSTDTAIFVADKTYAPGDTVCVKSKRNGYPIWTKYEGTDTLRRNEDTLYVKDVVTFRLFIGGSGYKTNGVPIAGAPVFMTTHALDFVNPSPFVCVFRTKDTTEQVMKMVVSKDGDHLFVLTKKYSGTETYSIYRVSGFDTYRKPEEMDVSEAIHSKSAGYNTDNSRRMLQDAILVENIQYQDVLDIALDPQDNNRLVYVTNNAYGDRVYEITDALTAAGGTANCVSKDGAPYQDGIGIPDEIAVYSILIEMSNSDIAYIGTEQGVFRTENFTGAYPIWEPYNQGINGKVPVFKLYQQTNLVYGNTAVYYDAQGQEDRIHFQRVTNYGAIYAATHGLGVFIDSTYCNSIPEYHFPTGSDNRISMHVFPNPARTSVTVDFTLLNTNRVNISVFDVMGREILTKPLGYRMIGNHQEQIDCSSLSEGIYFVRINAGNQNQSAKIIISK